MAGYEDDYDYDDDEIYDDFCLNVAKKEKPKQTQQQLNADDSIAKVIKKIEQLTIVSGSMNYLQKMVIDKKIKDIGDEQKVDKKFVEIQAIANRNVKPFEKLENENVVIEIYHRESDFKGPIHYYSRYTQIGETETEIDDVYVPVTSGMKFDHDFLTLMSYKNIVINKILHDSKTLEEVIAENPTKIVKIFQEIFNLILDVEVKDNFFWSHNSNGAKNVYWQNNKWIVLNGDFKVDNAGFISNIIKVLDLFKNYGMSMKQLENEFYKAFQNNVWRRRPRYVYARIQKQYFRDD